MRPLPCAAALFLWSAVASATTVGSYGFSCITGNLAGDCAIGERQLQLTVDTIGTDEVGFHFANSGPAASAIARIYFADAAPGSNLSYKGMASSPGVAFEWGSSSPSSLPAGNTIGFLATDGMAGNAKNPKPKNGINPGEWLDIIFTLGNTNVDQLLKRLRNGSLDVGVHVQSYVSGGSESFVIKPTPVPLPAAGWLMFAGLVSWLGLSRRRRG